ncbi:MAG: hypothetical protein DWQ07_02320 [Chloroflexi bacterium]|nr:MAG: hypothetical protein DWQ07_02320 [Chloroflexota bacterium]MBL1193666.1 hypothetical protein [Chloroflexota bacterium]NOH10958.1 c-type cytochrome [Chloroflexota bacterium]
MKRLLFIFMVLAGALVFSVNYAQAGGWAVVSLVELPRSIKVNEVVELQFRVLQHGVTPAANLESYVELMHVASGDEFSFQGQYDSLAEVYSVEVSFPKEGEWQWQIVAFGEHAMPILNVTATPEAANDRVSTVWWRVWLDNIFGRPAAPQEKLPLTQMYSSDEEYGAALFIAKGCVTCHMHSDVPNSGAYVSSFTPDLTNFSASETYLQAWLADPLSIKPDTDMPNLGLNDEEIRALIAFLNND